MKNLCNIEKSAFRRGEYVGYANGAWKIYRNGGRKWYAEHRTKVAPFLSASTLAEMSDLLLLYNRQRLAN